MARPQLLPIISATVLTVAAALSIAAEHVRTSPAAALGTLLMHPVPRGTGDEDAGRMAPRDAAVTPAKGTAALAPSPAVGSRALGGSEEECPADGR